MKLPEDFRSTHPSATTLHGSTNPHFVIPSVPGWPIQVGGGHRTACDFLYGKSHTLLRFEAANGPSGQPRDLLCALTPNKGHLYFATARRVSCLGRSNRLVESCELSVGPLYEVKAHSRSLGCAQDDKVEGGGPPWHKCRWMDRVEKKLIWTSLSGRSPARSAG